VVNIADHVRPGFENDLPSRDRPSIVPSTTT
jgi:hypothetical protein